MPTYEYECDECGHTFERFQKMSDKPIGRCPKCRGKVRRLMGTGAGVIFKGSGFYETDYKLKGMKEGEKKERAEKTDKTEKTETPPKENNNAKKQDTSKQEKT